MNYPYGQQSDPSGQPNQPEMFPQYDPQQNPGQYNEPSQDSNYGSVWQQAYGQDPYSNQQAYGQDPYSNQQAYGQAPYGQQGANAYGTQNQYANYGQYGMPYSPYGMMSYTPANPPRPGVSFGQAIKLFFKNYATFYGRASRSEYWWTYLFNMIVNAALFIGAAVLSSAAEPYSDEVPPAAMALLVAFGIYWLATIVPWLSLSVRRLHDTGQSGWLYLLQAIPYVGWIPVLVLCAMESKPDGIRYDDPTGQQPVTD